MSFKYDFSGYVTKNNLRCSDGRVIRAGAFAEHGPQPQDQEDRNQSNQDDVVVVTHDGAPLSQIT